MKPNNPKFYKFRILKQLSQLRGSELKALYEMIKKRFVVS